MPELLLELFCEEIPARMQAQAARDLERLMRDQLAEAGFTPELRAYAGPRRLTLAAENLPPAQADRTEERKGPRANAPAQAIEGFLRSTGLTRDQLQERDGVLFAVSTRPGRPTAAIVAEAVEAVVRGFPWPKSMRLGQGSLRWVRPLRRILCVFEGQVVPFSIEGVESGDLTEGHRVHGSGRPIPARSFADYSGALEKEFVVLDPEERRSRIVEGARRLCAERGLELVEDVGLLEEVLGLAEWPVPILGDMDPAFLDLPPEVIRTSMRTHQKYFAVRTPAAAQDAAVGNDRALAPHFLAVANIEASDGGQAMAAGYSRVLSARLNDARFFWNEDKRSSTDEWLEKLRGVTFHAKLGTMAERVERIAALARELAKAVGAEPDQAAQAGRLAKADLASLMVGEFPELQGVMGGYYVAEAGLEPAISEAIRDHYKPVGPSDSVPSAPVTVAVALADKIDLLLGFFEIDERPTGSRDPFALRRAALGVVNILLDNGLRIPLRDAFGLRFKNDPPGYRRGLEGAPRQDPAWAVRDRLNELASDVLAFLADRLKVRLREQGRRHDLVDAVFALGDDDLVRIVAKVEALDAFLGTEDGANLLAGYRRAVNILKAESKKTGERYDGGAINRSGAPNEERALMDALSAMRPGFEARLKAEDFAGAMERLATLRGPVDRFFEAVLVNDPDPVVRKNRLQLLSEVRAAMNRVADFSLVAG
ncbi:MAG: glycine--tRNA ligase subunit beta [Pseudomonadota bacterium]|nr:glycine--tRNA ligase subunit beta [Pseudomonadota bacterium]